MTKNYDKYLQKLPKNFRFKLLKTVKKIRVCDLEGLDVKKMKGTKNNFRCRVGKFRIIFELKNNVVNIVDINVRGNIY